MVGLVVLGVCVAVVLCAVVWVVWRRMRADPSLVLAILGRGEIRMWAQSEEAAGGLLQQAMSYFDHGVQLPPRAVVLDVGANIGAFAVLAAKASEGAHIIAVEPSAWARSALLRNSPLLAGGATMEVFGCALGRCSDVGVPFSFFPRCPEISSLHINGAKFVADMHSVGERLITARSPELPQWLLHLPRPLALLCVRFWLRLQVVGERMERCNVMTVSDLLAKVGIDGAVDLLKVDVEGAEWDVLQGVKPSDWTRIRQVVVEVHDDQQERDGTTGDGKLAQVLALLERHGFTTTVAQEPMFQGSHLYLVHADRSG